MEERKDKMAYPQDLIRSKDWGTEILTDADLEGQIDLLIAWIMAALDSTTGHAHEATSNKSPKINVGTGLIVTNQALGDVLYASSASAFARLAGNTTTTKKFLTQTGNGAVSAAPTWSTLVAGDIPTSLIPYIKVSDQKAQNTDGGTFTSGDWRTRDINTENHDTGGKCSIAGNQITLDAGTYICLIRCPAYRVASHEAQLYNVTDAGTVLIGGVARNDINQLIQTDSIIQGLFILAAQKTLEIRHICETTFADYGFGYAGNFGTEVYTVAEFWKIA